MKARRDAPAAAAIAAIVAAVLLACGGADLPGEADGADGSSPARRADGASSDTALAAMARELLPELERRSGLQAVSRPRIARRSRDELESFLTEELAEQLPPEEAASLEAAYHRLGLLPDSVRLGDLLRRLYMEQVVGYYDPEADTLFVLEDVPAEEARTVLAHELVHALQDQHVDLDSLTAALRERNDRSAAARAAIEGQATFVMAEWAVARRTGSSVDLTQMPGVAERFAEAAAGAAPEEMPAFSAAPRIVRETLTFPYVGGLRYVTALWGRADGRPAPFGARLPASTEQVLHPDRGPGRDRDAPTDVTFTAAPPGAWSEDYAGSMGELETRVYLSVRLESDSTARSAAAGWDGDRVRLLRSRGREALLWVSVWDTPAEAEAFGSAARRALRGRYGEADARAVSVERFVIGGRPAVRIVDRPSGVPADSMTAASRVELSGGEPEAAAGSGEP